MRRAGQSGSPGLPLSQVPKMRNIKPLPDLQGLCRVGVQDSHFHKYKKCEIKNHYHMRSPVQSGSPGLPLSQGPKIQNIKQVSNKMACAEWESRTPTSMSTKNAKNKTITKITRPVHSGSPGLPLSQVPKMRNIKP